MRAMTVLKIITIFAWIMTFVGSLIGMYLIVSIFMTKLDVEVAIYNTLLGIALGVLPFCAATALKRAEERISVSKSEKI